MKKNITIKEYEPQRLKNMDINDTIDYLENSGNNQAIKTINNRLKQLDLNYINYKTYLEDNYVDDYHAVDVQRFYHNQAYAVESIYITDNDIGNIDISIQYIGQVIGDANIFTITEEGYEEV